MRKVKHATAYVSEIVGMALFFGAYLLTGEALFALVSALFLVLIGLEWDAPA